MTVNVMLDLETLSTSTDAAVIAIGAVAFDENAVHTDESFYVAIDLNDAIYHGHVSGDTLKWWMWQSSEAKKASFEGTTPVVNALVQFNNFIEMTKLVTQIVDDRRVGNNFIDLCHEMNNLHTQIFFEFIQIIPGIIRIFQKVTVMGSIDIKTSLHGLIDNFNDLFLF